MVFNVTGLEKVPPDCSGQVDVPATSLPGSLSSSLLLGEIPWLQLVTSPQVT